MPFKMLKKVLRYKINSKIKVALNKKKKNFYLL